MPQDAFTIKFIAVELDSLLKGGKISKITQPDRDTLSFIIYTAKGSVKLDACLSARDCRVSLTGVDKPPPKVAPGFCMLLRKHLANAEITGVRQIPFERIVVFSFVSVSEFEKLETELYFEVMGKYSNAVLTAGGVILGALKTAWIGENTKRALMAGVKYKLPEPQDKILPCDLPALENLLSVPAGDVAKRISDNVKGVAYSTACDIAERYSNSPSAAQVKEYLCGGEYSPCVTYENGEEKDFAVRRCSGKMKLFPTLLSAQKEYYDKLYVRRAFSDRKKRLDGALASAEKKLEKRLQSINEKLLACREAETVKLKGELLTANIYAVKRGDGYLEAVNYYDAGGGKIKIALDRSLTPAQNAQNYYKRYAKLKRTQKTVSAQKTECESAADYLSGIRANLCAAESLCDLEETEQELKKLGLIKENGKKEKPPAMPFRKFVCGDFTLLAGRNNIQNDRLLKTLSPCDMWLHTHGYHSAHVGIVTGGKEVPAQVLLTAAEICAYYSDGRGGGKVPVDYTLKKFVKKPPAANAGAVVYTEYKTILAEPAKHPELAAEEG